MSRIHEELGRPAVGLAYPNGGYDARVLEVTRSPGIDLAFTMEPGPVSLGRVRKHPLQVARVSVESSDDLSSFRLQTMGASAALTRVRRLRSL